jgi:hypothetical protein
MTNYTSLELGGGLANARNYPVSGPGVGGRTPHAARGQYTITAALALNDTIQMFDLPPNARITGGFIKSDDLDTNGSPTIVYSLGDAGSSTRFFSGATVGQTGTFVSTLNFGGLDYVTTGKTRVFLTVTTGPATGATTGTIVCVLHYWVNEPA